MLRSKASGMQGIEAEVGSLECGNIEFGFEGKMVHMGGAFQQFEFEVATQGAKEVVGLCDHGLRW